MYNDKTLKSVAEAVKQVMEAELSAKQKAIAKIAEPKHKIDGADFAALRAGKKPVKEGWDDMLKAAKEKKGPQPSGGAGKKAGHSYGGGKQKDDDKPMKEEASQEEFTAEIKKAQAKSQGKEKAEVAKPAVVAVKQESVEQVNEDSTKLWKDHGNAYSLLDYHTNNSGDRKKILAHKQKLDGIEKKVKEKFGNSVLSAMKKHTNAMADSWYGHSNVEGERRAAEIRKKHKINWNGELNEGVEQIDERTLSEPETAEKERLVKGMKKGLKGFKERYGERGKSVMYATATKLAKGEK